MREYNNSTTNYPGCAYSNVKNYQSSANASQGKLANYFVVHDVNPVLSYDTLVKGHSTNGYATIQSAYGDCYNAPAAAYKKIFHQDFCGAAAATSRCTECSVAQVPGMLPSSD